MDYFSGKVFSVESDDLPGSRQNSHIYDYKKYSTESRIQLPNALKTFIMKTDTIPRMVSVKEPIWAKKNLRKKYVMRSERSCCRPRSSNWMFMD